MRCDNAHAILIALAIQIHARMEMHHGLRHIQLYIATGVRGLVGLIETGILGIQHLHLAIILEIILRLLGLKVRHHELARVYGLALSLRCGQHSGGKFGRCAAAAAAASVRLAVAAAGDVL